MTSDPFEAPADRRDEGATGIIAIGVWALAGACLGLAIGAGLHVAGATPRHAAPIAVGGAAVMGLAGWVADRLERAHARGRPSLPVGSGAAHRPRHAALFLVPIGMAVPALLWLMVAGSLVVGSMAPALGFGAACLAAAWASAQLRARQRLVAALEAIERPEAAAQELIALEGGLFTSGHTRDVARLNLGLIALERGDTARAAHWLSRVVRPAVRAHAVAALALVHVIRNDPEAATRAIAEAIAGGRQVRSQVDLVRVLLVLRTEGAAEALALADRLVQADSGPLFERVRTALAARGGEAHPVADGGPGWLEAFAELRASGSRTR